MGRTSPSLIAALSAAWLAAACASWLPDLESRPPVTLSIERRQEGTVLAFLRLPDGRILAAGWGPGAAEGLSLGLLDRGAVSSPAVALLDAEAGAWPEDGARAERLLGPQGGEAAAVDDLRLLLLRGGDGAALRVQVEDLVVLLGPPAAVAPHAAESDVAALLTPETDRPRVAAVVTAPEPADPELVGPVFRLAPGERLVLALSDGEVRRVAKREFRP